MSMDFPKFLLHFSIILIKILNVKSTGKKFSCTSQDISVELVF